MPNELDNLKREIELDLENGFNSDRGFGWHNAHAITETIDRLICARIAERLDPLTQTTREVIAAAGALATDSLGDDPGPVATMREREPYQRPPEPQDDAPRLSEAAIRAEVFAALTSAADENDYWTGGSDPACQWTDEDIAADLLAYNDDLQTCEPGDLIPHVKAWRIARETPAASAPAPATSAADENDYWTRYVRADLS